MSNLKFDFYDLKYSKEYYTLEYVIKNACCY